VWWRLEGDEVDRRHDFAPREDIGLLGNTPATERHFGRVIAFAEHVADDYTRTVTLGLVLCSGGFSHRKILLEMRFVVVWKWAILHVLPVRTCRARLHTLADRGFFTTAAGLVDLIVGDETPEDGLTQLGVLPPGGFPIHLRHIFPVGVGGGLGVADDV
jgi:hypothetical protein